MPCLALSRLVSLMANLGDEISALEAEIVKLTAWLDKAVADGNEGREERYANLITAIRKDITVLRQQQQAQGE